MSDTTTTTETATEFAPLMFTVAPGSQVERHPNVAWELAHAEAKARAAEARIAELTTELDTARSAQITDGSDPRLGAFWEKAGRIADYADFCEEYDRMAEAMDGPRRQREYDVTLTLSVTVQITRTVTAEDSEDAESYASDDLDNETIIAALEGSGIDDWEVRSANAERA